mmetsp:Transcript_5995/g.9498  ORF Transcript_5995/g.9498 Transcript_5995/m.9498 type:complete len:82 (-) Transcript_5995:72-317(-)|eukprot:CAMPEP_0194240290 /NCGR_PEP_ID=MMETSP0158-20130606/6512_1 /TAXON_ID=33649 /ORGANISM="Thalassionema nitzschioides, Strain L26-B" /LENGTH=81 /DNA_ID=CAMNT_0038974961 /DNA_START=195 /DNA_END=440 /DNA_ORIENTATION=+
MTQTEQSRGKNSMSQEAQMGMMLIALGASAGFTLYMKRSGVLMKRVANIKRFRRFPTKYGPMTKAEWEKVKPRWNKEDDDF